MTADDQTERETAPVWRSAWRTFQDPFLGGKEPFPSPFESFVAGYLAARLASPAPQVTREQIADEIRRVDGNHTLGAAALADAILALLTGESDAATVEDNFVDPEPWVYTVSGKRTAHPLPQTYYAKEPRTRKQYESDYQHTNNEEGK